MKFPKTFTMFKRTEADLPKDPFYPANLADLGYTVNDEGQFVHVKTGEFFEYSVTDNERANQMHCEAMHKCARKAVLDELTKYVSRSS